MANKKITALTAITALDVADVLPVADVSIPETKKITAANLWLGGFNAHKDIDGTFAANSDLVFPTQKAAKTYVNTAAAAKISDTAFGAGWNAVTTIAPSKNAVYDAFQLYLPLAGGTMTGNIVMPNAGTIGQAAGPIISFKDNKIGIGIATPGSAAVYMFDDTNNRDYGLYVGRTVTDQTTSIIGVGVAVRDIATANHAQASYGNQVSVYVGASDGSDSYNRTGAQYGVQGFSWHNGTGTCSSMYGGYFGVRTSKAGGTISNAYSLYVNGGNTVAATIDHYFGLRIGETNTGGTITIDYGIYIDSLTGTNRYAIRIADQSGGSSNYAIYTGAGAVRIGGEFGCNGATPRAKATVNAACSDLATAVALLNQIRTALINNGICQ